jgi:hypothetical protein
MTMTPRHELFRVQDRDGNLYRADDGRTRFPYLAACSIANRINGRVIK